MKRMDNVCFEVPIQTPFSVTVNGNKKKSMKTNKYTQSEIDFNKKIWPDNDLFPLNIKTENRKVQIEIEKDIADTKDYLIVTGFTSLSHIIDFFGHKVNFNNVSEVKIILGFYPLVRSKKWWDIKKLPDEIKDEWLSKGVSLFNGGGTASIQIIEFIKDEKIKFKFSDKLHAKIYVSDNYAILGSSNFSKNGLQIQKEANIRIENADNNYHKEQYSNIKQIGNNFYEQGIDFTNEIIGLLKQLLSVTTWKETLARAINELIEVNSFENDPEILEKINDNNLWPSQKTAIGRALNILQEHQNVLIAEPTGSGKTKVISVLNIILSHWLSETGKRKQTQSLIICPPLVVYKWEKEFLDLNFLQPSTLSHGILSSSNSKNGKDAIKKIKIADLLIIDEAHNYLNKSIRSNAIAKSLADNIILATATPINKKAKDLLRLIEILDVDNLTDKELEKFKELKRLPFVEHKKKQLKELEKFIWKFTVRRTKNELKEIIEKEPSLFRDINGKKCKYPKHNKKIYKIKDTKNDRNIATQINNELQKLKGIINLQRFERLPNTPDDKIKEYVNNRLKISKALAIYKVQEALRSSKFAIIEHIEGTEKVKENYDFKITKNTINGVIQSIINLKQKLPKLKNISKDLISEKWLIEIEKYKNECENEILIYKNISDLAKRLSITREQSKIDKILNLFKHCNKILSFDHIVITLDFLNAKLNEHKEINSFVVTGSSNKSKRNKIFDIFSLKQEEYTNKKFENKKVIALCSDAMSDSVDLQKAENLVFLDMPSVLRIAEQRIGRIDRLDSPHDEITVYWTKDSPEFTLKTDKKLIKTLDIAKTLIGINFELPDEIKIDKIDTEDYINEFDKYTEKNDSWEGIKDAYQYVYDLYKGENTILELKYVEELKNVTTRVNCNLSIGFGQIGWIFLALKGDKENPARWYFIKENEQIVFYELEKITTKLRENLSDDISWITEKKWIPKETDEYLNKYLKILQKNEKELLPNKKKRALKVAEKILLKIQLQEQKKSKKQKNKNYERLQLFREILSLFKTTETTENYGIDFNHFANIWLDYFEKPLELKKERNKDWRKVISLDSFLTSRTNQRDLDFRNETLKEIINNVKYKKQTWNNVIACIIAIPDNQSP